MNIYVILAIAISAFVTLALRALPFIVFGNGRKLPSSIEYLGKTLPYAVMGMLVVYCLKETTFVSVSHWMPQLIAGVLVVATYVWKRSTILSILTGTISYMILVQFVF